MDKYVHTHEIGFAVLKMVKKAIKIIQRESEHIIVEAKIAYDGTNTDLATNGDKKAQEMYLEEIRERFPTYGIIAEEANLRIPCTDPDHDIYFTIDPLDGTKAYKRGQSFGVGTMIAIIYDDEVMGVIIGDVNTGEIYSYCDIDRRGDVSRTRFGGQVSKLTPNIAEPLRAQYVAMRESERHQPKIVREMIQHPNTGGLFKDCEAGGGSIGLHFARLWKGEIGALILSPGHTTPWDDTPCLGINRRLGFKHFRIDYGTGKVEAYEPALTKEVVAHDYGEIIVHEAHVEELMDWLARK